MTVKEVEKTLGCCRSIAATSVLGKICCVVRLSVRLQTHRDTSPFEYINVYMPLYMKEAAKTRAGRVISVREHFVHACK